MLERLAELEKEYEDVLARLEMFSPGRPLRSWSEHRAKCGIGPLLALLIHGPRPSLDIRRSGRTRYSSVTIGLFRLLRFSIL